MARAGVFCNPPELRAPVHNASPANHALTTLIREIPLYINAISNYPAIQDRIAWQSVRPIRPDCDVATSGDIFIRMQQADWLLHSRAAFGIALPLGGAPPNCLGCGCSSGVEHDLAKVGVEGSNPFARSRIGKSISISTIDSRRKAALSYLAGAKPGVRAARLRPGRPARTPPDRPPANPTPRHR